MHGDDPLLRPGELRALRPTPRRRGGYDTGEVDQLLEDVAATYETLWNECERLRRLCAEQDRELDEARQSQHAISDSLVTAQRVAAEVRRDAEQAAERVIEEAGARAARLLADAEQKRERLTGDISRLREYQSELHTRYRAFLLSALDMLNGERDDSGDERQSNETPTRDVVDEAASGDGTAPLVQRAEQDDAASVPVAGSGASSSVQVPRTM
jgi:DivIVA domain-containing protein